MCHVLRRREIACQIFRARVPNYSGMPLWLFSGRIEAMTQDLCRLRLESVGQFSTAATPRL